MDESESKGIIADKNLLQVCSTGERKSEIVIINGSSKEESKSESVHKIINTNKEKYAIYDIEDENLWLQITQSSMSQDI